MSAKGWMQTLMLSFLAGVLLDFHWLVYFSAAVTVIMGVAHLWRSKSLEGVRYTRRFHYTRGFPGEETEVRITAENTRLLPVPWLRAVDPWSFFIGPTDEGVLFPGQKDQGLLINIFSLRWRERVTRAFPLRFRKRGIYEVGPVSLEAGDPFGLYTLLEEASFEKPGHCETLTVFPEILPLERLKLPAEDPFGEQKARKPLFDDPNRTMGIRPYHPEDGFRRVHWQATARTGELQSRLYQPVTARVVVLCLNVTTEEHVWLGYSPAVLEHMIKICATLAYHGVENGYSIGLISNGCMAQSDQPFRIHPGRSPNQLSALLTALAGVTPYTNTAFANFLLRSMTDIPFGASLVIVTAQLPPALQDTLIRLQRYRPYTTVFSLDKTPPPDLPGIRAIHLPFEEAPVPVKRSQAEAVHAN